jgi:hypothetical protein
MEIRINNSRQLNHTIAWSRGEGKIDSPDNRKLWDLIPKTMQALQDTESEFFYRCGIKDYSKINVSLANSPRDVLQTFGFELYINWKTKLISSQTFPAIDRFSGVPDMEMAKAINSIRFSKEIGTIDDLNSALHQYVGNFPTYMDVYGVGATTKDTDLELVEKASPRLADFIYNYTEYRTLHDINTFRVYFGLTGASRSIGRDKDENECSLKIAPNGKFIKDLGIDTELEIDPLFYIPEPIVLKALEAYRKKGDSREFNKVINRYNYDSFSVPRRYEGPVARIYGIAKDINKSVSSIKNFTVYLPMNTVASEVSTAFKDHVTDRFGRPSVALNPNEIDSFIRKGLEVYDIMSTDEYDKISQGRSNGTGWILQYSKFTSKLDYMALQWAVSLFNYKLIAHQGKEWKSSNEGGLDDNIEDAFFTQINGIISDLRKSGIDW